ncbi:AAA family ATPase [Arthrobacter flavus]|uniref:AAA family ATPase n=1 Tax=Arthrobacter flavus TaxID=95172 RepID=A0ABW4Q831_9MICC
MDLNEVESRARQLLAAMLQFEGHINLYQILSVIDDYDESWHTDPVQVRLNMRALELLTKLKYADVMQGGYAHNATTLGRRVAEVGWPTKLAADWLDEWVEHEQMLEALNERRESSENAVSRLVVSNWRQFSNVDIIFHPRLTILTGANGAGKTTLLNILGPHFDWAGQLLTQKPRKESSHTAIDVGQLLYSNGTRSPILQHLTTGVQNSPLSITHMQQVPGLFINSHRSISAYQRLESLPARFSEYEVLQQDFASEIQIRYSGGSSEHSPLYRMKEALVAAAMFAYGNQAVRPNASAKEVWEGYQEVLRRFLPASLQFERFEVEDSELILVTGTESFPLEAVSGGISAMLELSWQIFLRQRNQASFSVCIDEPENHLHPELQRSIVPSLLAGFPAVTFIIATHSPFVVTSTPDAFVYALGAEEDGRISSRIVSDINTSATPDETLMSVLGLDTALPLWAESRLSQLMDTLSASPSVAELRGFRDQLEELGLDRQFPAAVRSLGPSSD